VVDRDLFRNDYKKLTNREFKMRWSRLDFYHKNLEYKMIDGKSTYKFINFDKFMQRIVRFFNQYVFYY
jgi:hypothetical protein